MRVVSYVYARETKPRHFINEVKVCENAIGFNKLENSKTLSEDVWKF